MGNSCGKLKGLKAATAVEVVVRVSAQRRKTSSVQTNPTRMFVGVEEGLNPKRILEERSSCVLARPIGGR
eukprot:15433027-Alexandrium_andersonii.AAC.1